MELHLLTDIVIIFGLAVTVLLIFHFLHLPSVVGLLLTGILAGPHSFGLVGAVHEVEMLAEIGVILLLFSIGIEFSFKKLIEIKRQVVVGGTLQVGLTVVAVFLISNLLGLSTADAVFIGFLIAPQAKAATEEDWQTEYLAPILAIRIVSTLNDAMDHIARYSSGHTEAIVTEHIGAATQFQRYVDSSSVYVNLPTCFADGFEYGLGAEIGISTNRMHARGPVGLEGLTTLKWVLTGDGQLRG